MKKKTFNYYFLKKYLHPDAPAGYRENLVMLVFLKGDPDKKFLLIQEKNFVWTLPKKGIDAPNLIDGIVDALSRNIAGELGFKGIVSDEIKPRFEQMAYLVNFMKQKYDPTRAVYERKKGRPVKGKIYHLAILSYTGPELLPVERDFETSYINRYEWVTLDKAISFSQESKSLYEKDNERYSETSLRFNENLIKKAWGMHDAIEGVKNAESEQIGLF